MVIAGSMELHRSRNADWDRHPQTAIRIPKSAAMTNAVPSSSLKYIDIFQRSIYHSCIHAAIRQAQVLHDLISRAVEGGFVTGAV